MIIFCNSVLQRYEKINTTSRIWRIFIKVKLYNKAKIIICTINNTAECVLLGDNHKILTKMNAYDKRIIVKSGYLYLDRVSLYKARIYFLPGSSILHILALTLSLLRAQRMLFFPLIIRRTLPEIMFRWQTST